MPLKFGETPSGLMVPVALNEDGSLIGSGQGYIGAAWQKQPLTLGYSGDKTEEVSDLSASAGTNALSSAAVPAGEIWIVEAIMGVDVDSAPTSALLMVRTNGNFIVLEDMQTIAAGENIVWSGACTLSEGDLVRATFYGCTLNDDLFLRYHARRIDVDQ